MSTSSTANATGALLPISAAPQNWIGGAQLSAVTNGTAKNDAIYGDASGITLAGGAGDDTYYIYGAEKVVEGAGQGTDTIVAAWTDVVLPANVENLQISGNFSGTGNSLNNIITGDGAAQRLDGGAGDDILTGGGGADTFVFQAGSGRDMITDFSPSGKATVQLTGYSQFQNLGQVQAAMTQVGADVSLRLDATDSILFKNTQVSAFTSSNFSYGIAPTVLHQTFAEDFNSLSLWNGKTGTWRTDYGYGTNSDSLGSRTLTSNGELEIYTDPSMKGQGSKALGLNPFSLNNGVLTITAAPTPAADLSALYNYAYTSGLLTTKNSFAQEYGYFEVRAELPSGSGAWPAFWLLPASGGWPPELDVMESYGTNQVTSTTHSGTSNISNVTYTNVPGATTGFHTYGMLWDADHITWYVDGTQVGQVATPSDMHQAMYMLLDLAVAKGADPATLPAQFQIDYVHAYALATGETDTVLQDGTKIVHVGGITGQSYVSSDTTYDKSGVVQTKATTTAAGVTTEQVIAKGASAHNDVSNEIFQLLDKQQSVTYSSDFGHSVISGFKVASDDIYFNSSFANEFQSALSHLQDDGHGNTLLTLDPNNTILFSGVTSTQLTNHLGDFHLAS